MLKVDEEIGILCYKEHELPGVKEKLKGEGIEVSFYNVKDIDEQGLYDEEIEKLDVIWGKESKVPVLETVKKAEEKNVKTVNTYETHLAADFRPASNIILEKNGFNVPDWGVKNFDKGHYSYKVLNNDYMDLLGLESKEVPNGDKIVRKDIVEMLEHPGPEVEIVNGEDNRYEKDKVFEEYKENHEWYYKLYGIDTQEKIKVHSFKAESPLKEENPQREPIEVDKEIEEDVAEIMNTFKGGVLSIDMLKNGYVLDVNSAPNPRGTAKIEEDVVNCLKNLAESYECG